MALLARETSLLADEAAATSLAHRAGRAAIVAIIAAAALGGLSIGLHQRDNDRLIGTLKHLRDIGNSVIVV